MAQSKETDVTTSINALGFGLMENRKCCRHCDHAQTVRQNNPRAVLVSEDRLFPQAVALLDMNAEHFPKSANAMG